MEKPFLSVILPVYKVEAFLPATIPSILNQSFKDFELIIINDGSTDNSLEICNEFAKKDSRIKVFSQKNKGLSCARNTGMEKASAEIFVFVDSDDIINRDMLKCLAKPFQKNPDCLISACNFMYFDDKVEFSADTFAYNKVTPYELYYSGKNHEGYTIYVTAWAKAYKKSLFKKIKYPEHKYHEDVFVTCKLLYTANHVYYSEYPGYFYRTSNPTSVTKLPGKKRQIDYMHGQISRMRYLKKREKEIFQIFFDFYVEMFSKTKLQNRAFRNLIFLIPFTNLPLKRKCKLIIQWSFPHIYKILKKVRRLYGLFDDNERKKYKNEREIKRIEKAKLPPLHPAQYDAALSKRNCEGCENDKCIETVSRYFAGRNQ